MGRATPHTNFAALNSNSMWIVLLLVVLTAVNLWMTKAQFAGQGRALQRQLSGAENALKKIPGLPAVYLKIPVSQSGRISDNDRIHELYFCYPCMLARYALLPNLKVYNSFIAGRHENPAYILISSNHPDFHKKYPQLVYGDSDWKLVNEK